EAAAAKAGRNRLGGRVQAREGSVPTGEPPFDLVLANLIASVLIALAPLHAGELRPGGTLLASSIFVDGEADVRSALADAALDVRGRTLEGEWIALEAVRR